MPNNLKRVSGAALLAAALLGIFFGLHLRPAAAQTAGQAAGRGADAPALPAQVAPAPAPPSQGLPIVARFSYADAADLQRLAGAYDVWSVDRKGRTVVALLLPGEVAALRAEGRTLTVLPDETALVQRPPAAAASAVGGIPGYACYRTVDETHADLAALAASHPELARWVDIGDSWRRATLGEPEGADIYALALTSAAHPGPKPRFFLLAAIHARELTTAETAARFAERLVAGYGRDPEITWLLDYAEVHIVPQANPDGRRIAETGPHWRKNANDTLCSAGRYGVDLNRNASFKWNVCEGCSSGGACDEIYRGSAPASEPEVQALQSYLASIFPDRRGPLDTDPVAADAPGLYVSLHSFARQVLFPWDWSQPGTATYRAPNFTQLQTLGRKFGHYFGDYEVCQAPECLYRLDGSVDDWIYGELGVASYTFELGTAFFESCTTYESEVVTPTLDALLYAAKATFAPYTLPAGPDVTAVSLAAPFAVTGTLSVEAVADDSRFRSGPANDWGVEPTQPISAVRYTLDAPSWISATAVYTMAAVDSFDGDVEAAAAQVDLAALAQGRHTLFVEAQDADGNWGPPTAAYLYRVAATSYMTSEPGSVVTHTLTISNPSAAETVYTISFLDIAGADAPWPAVVYSPTLTVPPSGAAFLSVTVAVPADAPAGASSAALLAVTAGDGPAQTFGLLTQTPPEPPSVWLYVPWLNRPGE